MRSIVKTLPILFLLFSIVLLFKSHAGIPFSFPTSSSVLGTGVTDAPAMPGTCQEHSGLPDSTCTPGVVNSAVTQENIASTICVKGYTKTIRPSSSYTQSLKKQQIRAYGYRDTNIKDYEEDHLISLELGGNPTDPRNLWPEPGSSPNPKDEIENICNQKVCNGEISLAEAQKEIASDWKTACQ